MKEGIRHYDVYFPDGSCPTEAKVRGFLDAVEQEPGAVAVHCKAGLGRTGTLVACYAAKNYKIPVAPMIAWTRICRPGSVIGPQQLFLVHNESTLLAAPSIFSDVGREMTEITNLLKDTQIEGMSEKELEIATKGDEGQAAELLNKKRKFHKPN